MRTRLIGWFIKFNLRTQQPGESIASYVAELRRLSEHCGYGQSLDEMLRDRLVCGMARVRTQQRLLAEVDLTFEKAMKIAQAMKLAERDAKELRQAGPHPVEPVHKVSDKATSSQSASRKPPSPDGKPCFRCGAQHDPAQCRFREVQRMWDMSNCSNMASARADFYLRIFACFSCKLRRIRARLVPN